MPIIKSAKKALRQSQKRRKINAGKKVELKKTLKKYERLLKEDSKQAAEFLATVYKKLDKAAKTNLIKKNKASRTKSRMAAKIKK